MRPVIDLGRPGPGEREWAEVCDRLPAFAWPTFDRLVVVSPHPDDETLGAGGLIGAALERGLPVVVVSVTDGEAATDERGLAARRRAELARAMEQLDPTGTIETVALGFPDGTVGCDRSGLRAAIGRCIGAGDLVACPMPDDGHPDHEATALAATDAAGLVGAHVRWFPVWAWHCHVPGDNPLVRGERLRMSARAMVRKRRAVACYDSQLRGPTPVVPPGMLVRLLRPFEVLVRPYDPAA